MPCWPRTVLQESRMAEPHVCRPLHRYSVDAQTSLEHPKVQVYVENGEAEVQEVKQLRRMAVNSGANPDGLFDPLASTRASYERKGVCTHSRAHTHMHTLMCTDESTQAHIRTYTHIYIHIHTHTGNLKSTRWEPGSWSRS